MNAFIPAAPQSFFIPSARNALLSPRKTNAPRSLRVSRPVSMAATPPSFDEGKVLCVKAGPDGASMGDCPFSLKGNLALRFQGVDFNTEYINLGKKPDWFKELSVSATVPIFVDGDTILKNSDDVVEYADKISTIADLMLSREDDPRWDDAREAVLGEKTKSGSILGILVRMMRNKDPAEGSKWAEAMSKVLARVDTFLGTTEGPFVLGDKVSAVDFDLAPQLQHAMVAAPHYKGFEFPKELKNIVAYMDNMRATKEWKAAICPDDVIVWGWSRFF